MIRVDLAISPAKWFVIILLLGLPDHAFTGLNPWLNRSEHQNQRAPVHSNSSVIQLLLYDVITTLANKEELQLTPKLNIICALSQIYQHFFWKIIQESWFLKHCVLFSLKNRLAYLDFNDISEFLRQLLQDTILLFKTVDNFWDDTQNHA